MLSGRARTGSAKPVVGLSARMMNLPSVVAQTDRHAPHGFCLIGTSISFRECFRLGCLVKTVCFSKKAGLDLMDVVSATVRRTLLEEHSRLQHNQQNEFRKCTFSANRRYVKTLPFFIFPPYSVQFGLGFPDG